MFEMIFLVSFLLRQDVGGVSNSNTEMHQQDEGHSGVSTFRALSLHYAASKHVVHVLNAVLTFLIILRK